MLDCILRNLFTKCNVDAVSGNDQTLRAMCGQCRNRAIEIVFIGLNKLERNTE
jgi:hypothetical protein